MSWSPRRRQGSRPAATAAYPGCAVRKSPCSPESAPTTTCAWNGAATRTPRPRSSNHSRASCASTTSSGRICSASRQHAPGHRAASDPSTYRHGCTNSSPTFRSPRSSKGAPSTYWPPTPWPSRSPHVCGPARTGFVPSSSIPEEQAFHQDWTKATADFVAALRTTIGDDTDNPRFVELVGELALSSQRFRTLWARHDVRNLDGGTATVHHPVVGELRLHRDKLPIDDVILVVYYPDKGSDSDEKLQLLAALSHTAPAEPGEPTDTAQQASRHPSVDETLTNTGCPAAPRVYYAQRA